MIGKQLNFYITAQDQADLLTRINDQVKCLLIKKTADDEPYEATTEFVRSASDWALSYLSAPEYAASALQRISDGETRAVNLDVVEFIQSFQEGSFLRPGRFWFSPKRSGDARLGRKRAEFVLWASAVLRIGKKVLIRRSDGYFIGLEAAELSEKGLLQLKPW